MSFQMPNPFMGAASGYQVLGAAAMNARANEIALRKQTEEMQRLLMLGKDIPCPYCSQLIAKDALVCSCCQGNLGIGSWAAIRAALLMNPVLANRDSETFARLQAETARIDAYWAEEERKKEFKKLQDQEAARERARMEAEKAATEKRRIAELEKARLQRMSPFRRWVSLHKFLASVCLVASVGAFGVIGVKGYHIYRCAERGVSVDLTSCDLSGVNLSEAELSRAKLAGVSLFGTNLSKANLSKANLSKANLSKANLSKANLSGATLAGANLSGATLAGANLSGATLAGANLSGATLAGANLSGATLAGATLAGANLSGATLEGVDYWNTICPDLINSDNTGGTCVGHRAGL